MNENKIKIWTQIWKDLIDNFLKNSSFGLVFYSPHILIEDIITEIEENSLKNKENREYFYNKISQYLNEDIIVKKHLFRHFTLLRRVFKSDRNGYILEICNEIIGILNNGLYFQSSLDSIIEVLTVNEELSKTTIEQLSYNSQGLIIEFIKKGFAIEEIKNFPINIFDNARIDKLNSYVITNFPHNVDYKDFWDIEGNCDWTKYNQKVLDVVNNLSEIDRLKTLKILYSKKRQKVFYIFLIEGFKGETELTVNNIVFYNVSKRSFLRENTKDAGSEALQSEEEEYKFMQAAVEVDMLTQESSLSEATRKLEKTLNVLSCYISPKTKIKISRKKFLIVRDGIIIGSSSKRDEDDPFLKHHNSFDLKGYETFIKRLMIHFTVPLKIRTQNLPIG